MNKTLNAIWRAGIAGILGLIFFVLLDFVMWFLPPERGWAPWKWESSGPVAVGGNYSIELLTRSAHVFLAEYDQRLVVFGGTAREGKKRGTIDLQMNTGGRTHILVYFTTSASGEYLTLKDRFGIQRINMQSLGVEGRTTNNNTDKGTFLGTMSGEAYPLKFVPSSVWSEMEATRKLNG